MSHVLVIGGRGRAHALAWKLAQSPRVARISVAPGNGGTASFAHNIPVEASDVVGLMEFADSAGVDLTVVGPEEPLAAGLVDQFEAAGLRVFGPSRQAAMLESSKSYAKQIMLEQGVPTAPHEIFTQLDDALDYLLTHPVDEMVIKADGLARGKGVFLPQGESDAEGILRALLERDALGGAGRRVVIEQRLIGEELSVMAFTDGKTIAMMPAVRDHKRLYDKDIGPNTGGMGSYAPAPAMTPALAQQVRERIIEPVLHGLREGGSRYKGVIYAGVMLTQDGPIALEINIRLGDPGAQAVLPLLDTDLMDVIDACLDGTLDRLDVRWHDRAAVCVVLAGAGYPDRNDPDIPIILAPALPRDVILFHAGTRIAEDGRLVTTGGRVLIVTGVGQDLPGAMALAYDAVNRIHFDGVHYRADIGTRALWGT